MWKFGLPLLEWASLMVLQCYAWALYVFSLRDACHCRAMAAKALYLVTVFKNYLLK